MASRPVLITDASPIRVQAFIFAQGCASGYHHQSDQYCGNYRTQIKFTVTVACHLFFHSIGMQFSTTE
jgi:hypothetical protein